jgi:hypothetical protein
VLTTSLFFIKAKPDRTGAPSRVRITERGVPQQGPDDLRPLDRPWADNRALMPAPPSMPASPITRRDEERAKAAEPSVTPPARPAAPARDGVPIAQQAEEKVARAAEAKRADDMFAEAPSELGEGATPLALEQPVATDRSGARAAPAAAADLAPKGEVAGAGATPRDPYGSAMALYSAGRYAEAEKAFSAVAASGGKNAPYAALYAAKSAEANLGCGSAVAKYETAASRYGSTSAGAEAQWGAAGCYKTLGAVDRARSLYMTLRSVAGYRDRAEAELAGLAPAPRSPAKAPAKPAAAAAPK